MLQIAAGALPSALWSFDTSCLPTCPMPWFQWSTEQPLGRKPVIKRLNVGLWKKQLKLAILCDLFRIVKWPFQSLSDLQEIERSRLESPGHFESSSHPTFWKKSIKFHIPPPRIFLRNNKNAQGRLWEDCFFFCKDVPRFFLVGSRPEQNQITTIFEARSSSYITTWRTSCCRFSSTLALKTAVQLTKNMVQYVFQGSFVSVLVKKHQSTKTGVFWWTTSPQDDPLLVSGGPITPFYNLFFGRFVAGFSGVPLVPKRPKEPTSLLTAGVLFVVQASEWGNLANSKKKTKKGETKMAKDEGIMNSLDLIKVVK